MLEKSNLTRKILDISRTYAFRLPKRPEESQLHKCHDQADHQIPDVRELIVRDLRTNLCRLGYPAQYQPPYHELLNRWRRYGPPIREDEPRYQHLPDICVEMETIQLVCCVEVGAASNLVDAQLRLDRLLHVHWHAALHTMEIEFLVALVLVQKFESEAAMSHCELQIEDWLAAKYGPFNGIMRMYLPHTPRFSYSVVRAAHDRRCSWNRPDKSVQWPRYVSFCIWY